MKIRIKFSKQGPMKFIGHLDLMRYFQKAMRRADINIRYSEGFSPHQIMSFAAPLGVGITSLAEYMDIEVIDNEQTENSAVSAFSKTWCPVNSKAITDRLNQVMAEGIQILSCRKLEDSSKNAMSIVCAADYTITFTKGYEPEDFNIFFGNLTTFYEQEEILITKKTKKGQKEMDLKPFIYCLERRENSIFLQVSTGSTDNIKPELVMDAFYQTQNLEYPKFGFQMQREEIYGRENPIEKMIPLEEFGENIE